MRPPRGGVVVLLRYPPRTTVLPAPPPRVPARRPPKHGPEEREKRARRAEQSAQTAETSTPPPLEGGALVFDDELTTTNLLQTSSPMSFLSTHAFSPWKQKNLLPPRTAQPVSYKFTLRGLFQTGTDGQIFLFPPSASYRDINRDFAISFGLSRSAKLCCSGKPRCAA